jgi:hypothetical protein
MRQASRSISVIDFQKKQKSQHIDLLNNQQERCHGEYFNDTLANVSQGGVISH